MLINTYLPYSVHFDDMIRYLLLLFIISKKIETVLRNQIYIFISISICIDMYANEYASNARTKENEKLQLDVRESTYGYWIWK